MLGANRSCATSPCCGGGTTIYANCTTPLGILCGSDPGVTGTCTGTDTLTLTTPFGAVTLTYSTFFGYWVGNQTASVAGWHPCNGAQTIDLSLLYNLRCTTSDFGDGLGTRAAMRLEYQHVLYGPPCFDPLATYYPAPVDPPGYNSFACGGTTYNYGGCGSGLPNNIGASATGSTLTPVTSDELIPTVNLAFTLAMHPNINGGSMNVTVTR